MAARRLVDQLCHGNVPVLVLHDFDEQGFEISQRLTSVSDGAVAKERVRYEFENRVNVIDLGLRLEDVKQRELDDEAVAFKGNFRPDTIATPEEQKFLRAGRRVELNAFTSPDFIRWIEEKLAQHDIKKVIPDKPILDEAYRRAYHEAYLTHELEKMENEAADAAAQAHLPRGLRKRINRDLAKNPKRSWDHIVAEIAKNNLEKEE